MTTETRMRPEDLQFQIHSDTWQDALAKAATPLITRGAIDMAYVDSMIEAVKTLGPYIAIAPGLALGHARPSEAVHEACLAIATLDEPVEFGSKENDPIDIVVILAAVDDQAHLSLLQKMVMFLNEFESFDLLRQARTPEDATRIATLINDRK